MRLHLHVNCKLNVNEVYVIHVHNIRGSLWSVAYWEPFLLSNNFFLYFLSAHYVLHHFRELLPLAAMSGESGCCYPCIQCCCPDDTKDKFRHVQYKAPVDTNVTTSELD